jgi:hypothetical protein
MRPASIVQFERLFLGSLVVGLLLDLLTLQGNMALASTKATTAAVGPGLIVGMVIVRYVIALALWYFAARRASVVAKWILSVIFVFNACALAYLLFRTGIRFELSALLNIVAFLLFGWAMSYLFKPDADDWFAKKPSAG